MKRKESNITPQQRLLLETLAGHFAWLKATHPKKASSPLARKAQRSVALTLRSQQPSGLRKAA